MDEYLRKKRNYDNQLKNWDENNAKGYYLVLQHCPKELEADLRNQDSWKTSEDLRSIIAILLLIQDLFFNKTDRKRSIMATVEATRIYISAHSGRIRARTSSTRRSPHRWTRPTPTEGMQGSTAVLVVSTCAVYVL